jgi:hypothetical protein
LRTGSVWMASRQRAWSSQTVSSASVHLSRTTQCR